MIDWSELGQLMVIVFGLAFVISAGAFIAIVVGTWILRQLERVLVWPWLAVSGWRYEKKKREQEPPFRQVYGTVHVSGTSTEPFDWEKDEAFDG